MIGKGTTFSRAAKTDKSLASAPEAMRMATEYVEQRDGGYWVTGTRVSLDSIVYAFLRGSAPESIAQSFPVLKLEEVYGAIAYYLGHQADVDNRLRQHDREFETLRAQARQASPTLYKKLEESRKSEKVSQL
jgi:uncharacterized protein (DUF433 family)